MNKLIYAVVLLFFSSQLLAAELDPRVNLKLTPKEKEVFLSDMRVMLQTVQEIMQAISVEDREAIANAARQSGNQMARHTPMSIKQKLPKSFQAIGGPMHMSFEEFAIRAETDDMREMTAQLSIMMRQCMACHAAFKVSD